MSTNGNASGPLDPAAVRAALGHIQAQRQIPRRNDGSVSGETLPPTTHPFVAISRLAALWGLQHCADADVTAPAGPAAISAACTRIGLEAACETRRFSSLTSRDCPCILMSESGQCRLVTQIDEGAIAVVADGETFTKLPLHRLETGNAGLVVKIRRPVERAHAQNGRIEPPEKAHAEPISILGRIRQSLSGQKRLVVSLLIASVLINLLGLMLPMFSMAVFDRVIPHAAFETLWALALGVTVALGVEMALRNARLKLQDAVAQGLGVGLQCEAMGRQLHARTPDLPRHSGGLIQPVNDLDTIANLSPAIIVSALVDLPFFFIMVVLIASIGGVVALAPILGTLGLVAIHAFAHNISHRTSRAHGAIARRQHQMLIDTIAAQERIRVTNASGVFLSRFEQTADDCAFASHEIRYWHGLAAQLSAVLVQGVVVATIVIGVFQINAAAMTIGALSACILLVNRSMMPVSIVTGLAFRLMQVLESAAPVSAMLNATLEAGGADGRSLPTRIKGDVTFADVTFTYPGEDKPALKGISFTMKPGERIGLVGKSGCGKSSLLRMIVRLNEPTEGRMKLDERDIRQYDPAMLRRCIGFMPQDSTLIDGTLQDNLVLGLAAVDPDRFERICRMTGVHDIAARHPSGFNLQVGPGGQRLSAGERQCVSLARTLMGEPDLLLLDEPTSAFDNGHEQKIVAELRQLPSSTGMVIATHRTALLAIVDRIIWIDGGRIVADGAREDIFKRHGLAA